MLLSDGEVVVQTVQLQCGSCQNMMAISVEHLGAQVQCPHCAAVVQTPPPSALAPQPGPDPYAAAPPPPSPPPAPPPPPPPSIQVPERESIFSEPEPSDDLFDDGAAAPKIHMPEPAVGVVEEEPEPVAAYEEEEEQVDLTAMRSRVAAERRAGSRAPQILVFLVPYAIFTTAFIAYLLLNWPKIEAFEWLPDPGKEKPKVVNLPAHDLPVPAKLKVPLNQTVRVGHMEITPMKVELVDNSQDLQLQLKAKNVSTNQIIMPLEESFFLRGKGGAGAAQPFTFLEQPSQGKANRIYGGELEFYKGAQMVKFDGNLRPGEECIVRLTTDIGDAARLSVRRFLISNEPYQWRLQFRRGIWPIFRGEMSMTAVIGIEFTPADIAGAPKAG